MWMILQARIFQWAENGSLFVMAGLVPAIHVLLRGTQNVDARHKAGHDEPTKRAHLHSLHAS